MSHLHCGATVGCVHGIVVSGRMPANPSCALLLCHPLPPGMSEEASVHSAERIGLRCSALGISDYACSICLCRQLLFLERAGSRALKWGEEALLGYFQGWCDIDTVASYLRRTVVHGWTSPVQCLILGAGLWILWSTNHSTSAGFSMTPSPSGSSFSPSQHKHKQDSYQSPGGLCVNLVGPKLWSGMTIRPLFMASRIKW